MKHAITNLNLGLHYVTHTKNKRVQGTQLLLRTLYNIACQAEGSPLGMMNK